MIIEVNNITRLYARNEVNVKASSKLSRLRTVGLKHNPCQGCEAYQQNKQLFKMCELENNGTCTWITTHDEAIQKDIGD